jgi:hypothetical protein
MKAFKPPSVFSSTSGDEETIAKDPLSQHMMENVQLA